MLLLEKLYHGSRALCEPVLIYNFTQVLSMTISKTSLHFSIVGPRSRSQLHMMRAFMTFSDCPVFFLCVFFFDKQSCALSLMK